MNKFIKIVEEYNLVEIEPNVWIRKENPKFKYRLTPIGFTPIIEECAPEKTTGKWLLLLSLSLILISIIGSFIIEILEIK